MPEFQPRNFMLLPTLECQASCRYCFGPNRGETMLCAGAAVDFIEKIAPRDGGLTLTFHGGEPLLAEKGYYTHILPLLRERFGFRLRLSLQSNLWALTDGMIELIRRYDMQIGTSLDGFPEMCDAQCGEGYFARTMEGIRRLRENGVTPHCICTFTPTFAGRAGEVFEFFAHEHIPYSVHGAVRPLGRLPGELTVSADDLAQVLLDTFDAYRKRIGSNRVGTLDSMARGCLERKGSVCTFFDCLGKFAAIAPDGGIYACQRFCGQKEYALGNVRDLPSENDLVNSAAFRRLAEKQQKARAACGNCTHQAYCSGGCLYNMLAADSVKDPYCPAYQAVFDRLAPEMALEMGGIMTKRLSEKEAPVLAMAGDLPHPYDREADRYKRKWALKWGQKWAPAYIYRKRLHKLFLQITSYGLPDCGHEKNNSGNECKIPQMTGMPKVPDMSIIPEVSEVSEVPEVPALDIWYAVRDARQNGFRTVVISGAEPLIHSDIDNVLASIGEIDLKGMSLILHTSLGMELGRERLALLGEVFSEIMVSGACEKALSNLQCLKDLGYSDKIRLRSADLNLSNSQVIPSEEGFTCGEGCTISGIFSARYTCGLGQNLYIAPDGGAYPCPAWRGREKLLGNISEGLEDILKKEAFIELSRHHVDTNEKCKECRVRYLCGGMCKARVRDRENLDSGEFDCSDRKVALLRLAGRL